MIKRMVLLFGAAAALAAVLVVGCGKTTADTSTSTGCDANLPCAVSTNIN